jgi:ribosomal protein L40E
MENPSRNIFYNLQAYLYAMHYGFANNYYNESSRFRHPYWYYTVPKYLLHTGEIVLRQDPGILRISEPAMDMYMAYQFDHANVSYEGVLGLTDKRLIFYTDVDLCATEEERLKVDLPLSCITGTDHQSMFGYSGLVIKIDPVRMKGPGQIEIMTRNALLWENDVNHQREFGNKSVAHDEFYAEIPPVGKNEKLEKICLNCMAVCPEDVITCPKCGNPF